MKFDRRIITVLIASAYSRHVWSEASGPWGTRPGTQSATYPLNDGQQQFRQQQQQQQNQGWPSDGESSSYDPMKSQNDPPPLPEGWSEHFDPASGQPYYYNAADGTTTWDRPAPPAYSEQQEEQVRKTADSPSEEGAEHTNVEAVPETAQEIVAAAEEYQDRPVQPDNVKEESPTDDNLRHGHHSTDGSLAATFDQQVGQDWSSGNQEQAKIPGTEERQENRPWGVQPEPTLAHGDNVPPGWGTKGPLGTRGETEEPSQYVQPGQSDPYRGPPQQQQQYSTQYQSSQPVVRAPQRPEEQQQQNSQVLERRYNPLNPSGLHEINQASRPTQPLSSTDQSHLKPQPQFVDPSLKPSVPQQPYVDPSSQSSGHASSDVNKQEVKHADGATPWQSGGPRQGHLIPPQQRNPPNMPSQRFPPGQYPQQQQQQQQGGQYPSNATHPARDGPDRRPIYSQGQAQGRPDHVAGRQRPPYTTDPAQIGRDPRQPPPAGNVQRRPPGQSPPLQQGQAGGPGAYGQYYRGQPRDPNQNAYGQYGQQGPSSTYGQQYGSYGRYYPGQPGYGQQQQPSTVNALVAQGESATSAVKEAIGSAWQGLLGLGNRTKAVVGSAQKTVIDGTQRATQTLSSTSSSLLEQAKSTLGSVFESSTAESDQYSLTGRYGAPPVPGYGGPPTYSQQGQPYQAGYPYQPKVPPAQQGYPPQGQVPPAQQGYPPQGQVPPAQQGYPPQGQVPPTQQGYPPQGQVPPTQQGYPPQGQVPPAQQGYPPQGQYPPGYGYPQPRSDPPYPHQSTQGRPPGQPPIQSQWRPGQEGVPPQQGYFSNRRGPNPQGASPNVQGAPPNVQGAPGGPQQQQQRPPPVRDQQPQDQSAGEINPWKHPALDHGF